MGVDYSKRMSWLAIPEAEKEIDTFFLYPSSYLSPKDNFKPFADIRDENMIRIANKCLDMQASVFAEATNVYAPLYRQVDPFYGMSERDDGRQEIIQEVLMRDAVNSFEYFIDHLNEGRPFILAGHSQGTTILTKLMSNYLKDHQDLLKRMVAAYLIGFEITKDFFIENKHLKFAKGESDTGVILSWNTQMPNLKEVNPIIKGKPMVINPINWKRDDTYGSKKENKGSYINGEIIIPGIADAKINTKTGVLECSTVKPEDFKQAFDFFPEGVYHSMDYGFYYENIKENVAKRIKAFKQRSKENK